jgi:hypothetical protein
MAVMADRDRLRARLRLVVLTPACAKAFRPLDTFSMSSAARIAIRIMAFAMIIGIPTEVPAAA